MPKIDLLDCHARVDPGQGGNRPYGRDHKFKKDQHPQGRAVIRYITCQRRYAKQIYLYIDKLQ